MVGECSSSVTDSNLNVCSFSFNLKPSTLSTFSMPNGRLFQLEIVSGKKEYLGYMNHNLPGGV